MKKIVLMCAVVLGITAGSASAALVLSPTLGNPRLGTEFTPAYGPGDCNGEAAGAECLADVFNVDAADLTYLYKQNANGTPDDGLVAGSYTTTFNADLSGGTIVNTGSTSITCPSCYLIVKDGANAPVIYFFDLSTTWNGFETITLEGFWPNQGSISHVALYGTNRTVCTGCNPDVRDVPEPASLALLGLALLGAGIARRRK